MNIYIQAAGNVSPQNTLGKTKLEEFIEHSGNKLNCIEPDYAAYIDPRYIRRMSRIIKMGTAAAIECLKEAGIQQPGAIITGTAYGCLEDTGIFLKKLVEQNEEMLTPTAFIQSTHNTVGAQIALLLQCHQYNNTFVHRGFSFESALLDAVMLLQENEAETVLAGAADEITQYSHAILSRFNLYKNEAINNAGLYNTSSNGSIAGEGSAFFLLSKTASGNDYACLRGLHTFYKPANTEDIETEITGFLKGLSVAPEDIDIVILGKNGDGKSDEIYDAIGKTLFQNNSLISYKQLCGEYPTSTAFACWLAATIIKSGMLPVGFANPATGAIKSVLIYNNYQNMHHSLMFLQAC